MVENVDDFRKQLNLDKPRALLKMQNMEDVKQNDPKLNIVIKWGCSVAIIKFEN